MESARRLYLYLLSGIGLAVLVSGATLLLTTLLDALGLAAGTPMLDGDQALRERLTLATAMAVVALPVWLIHWIAAERSVRPGRPGADRERSSDVRGLYFAVAMGFLLIFAFVAASSLVESVVLALSGESLEFRNPAGDVALLLTTGAAWGYHLRVRERDWANGPLEGGAAALPRAYLYLAAFGGLMALLFGLVEVVELLGRLVFTDAARPELGAGTWLAYPLASGVGRILVGGATWLGHWWYAGRVYVDAGPRGRSERAARLRLAFYVAVIVVGAAGAVGYLGQAIGAVLETVLGVADAGAGALARDVVTAAVAACLFGAAWWLHQRWLVQEGTAPAEAPAPATAWRLRTYPLALVGLAFAAVSVAWLLALVIDVALGGQRTVTGGVTLWRQELATFAPYAVLGTALWLWQWSRVLRARDADPVAEADSTVRRAVLLIILAASVLAGIAALGVILYRVFGTLFGLDAPGDVAAELSTPAGSLAVAVAVAVYHGLALRRDQAERKPETEPSAAPQVVGLRLIGPSGADSADLDQVVRRLGDGLPEGYRLDADRRMS